MQALPRWKVRAFACAVVLLVGLTVEGASRILIRLTPALAGIEIRGRDALYLEQSEMIRTLIDPGSPRREQVDAHLGWRYRAGYVGEQDRISGQGLRGSRNYGDRPPEGVTRIAAFGDSFVYGTEVADHETWASLMERMDPRLEVLNYGVGGYGTDQAYLRYVEEGTALQPDIVLIGFTPVNLQRVVNVYRRFLSDRDMPLVKPRFVLGAGDSLELLPNPVPDEDAFRALLAAPDQVIALGHFDHWYQSAVYESRFHDHSAFVQLSSALAVRLRRRFLDPDRILNGRKFNTASSAYRIQLLVFRDFAAAVRSVGATPLVVVFPDAESVGLARGGHPTVYTALHADLRGMGLDVIDLADAFAAEAGDADIARWFEPGWHYSPEGNRVVAEWLTHAIRARRGEKPHGDDVAGGAAALPAQ
jgi:hypothetical protein